MSGSIVCKTSGRSVRSMSGRRRSTVVVRASWRTCALETDEEPLGDEGEVASSVGEGGGGSCRSRRFGAGHSCVALEQAVLGVSDGGR